MHLNGSISSRLKRFGLNLFGKRFSKNGRSNAMKMKFISFKTTTNFEEFQWKSATLTKDLLEKVDERNRTMSMMASPRDERANGRLISCAQCAQSQPTNAKTVVHDRRQIMKFETINCQLTKRRQWRE